MVHTHTQTLGMCLTCKKTDYWIPQRAMRLQSWLLERWPNLSRTPTNMLSPFCAY